MPDLPEMEHSPLKVLEVSQSNPRFESIPPPPSEVISSSEVKAHPLYPLDPLALSLEIQVSKLVRLRPSEFSISKKAGILRAKALLESEISPDQPGSSISMAKVPNSIQTITSKSDTMDTAA